MPLPSAPPNVADAEGNPRYGTYEGGIDSINLSRLTGQHQPTTAKRLVTHKRWLYSFVATRECIALCSMADLSYTSNAFLLIADLKSQRVLVDQGFLGLPKPFVNVSDEPGAGLEARFTSAGADFKAKRPRGDERYHLDVNLGFGVPLRQGSTRLSASLLAAGAAPPLTVIAPIEGGGVNVTQKWAGLLSFGSIDVKGQRFSLDGGVGGMDYTHGYLGRRTSWRWGFACGRLDDGTPIGLNLVEGFNETRDDVNENALWLGGKLYPLSRAKFSWNKADPLDPWHVETVDGEIKLTFAPIGAHREERDLKLVKSHFVQPVGLFEGTITAGGVEHQIKALPGVTEDQDILW